MDVAKYSSVSRPETISRNNVGEYVHPGIKDVIKQETRDKLKKQIRYKCDEAKQHT